MTAVETRPEPPPPPPRRPRLWPRFSSPLRSTTVTARIGSAVGVCFLICFITGMLSHYQYHPWSWLPEPAAPKWGYRITQGLHVATGTALIPLLAVKLWSVYPNLFRWPVVRSAKQAIERLSVFVLLSSAVVQLFTGFFNSLNWYPWPWPFVEVHRYLAYVVIGSILLHIGIKLPDINYGLRAKVRDGDVLTEIPWSENPLAHSNAGTKEPPPARALKRRGVLLATAVGVGTVVLTTIGQTVTPLEKIGLFATRQKSKGPQHVPVNKTAKQAKIKATATAPGYTLTVEGPHPFTMTLADIEAMASAQEWFPINCVEGWSANAHWQGVRLLDIVKRAGGDSNSRVHVVSLEKGSQYDNSYIQGPQVSHALLATHLNGQRLDLDHGYPLRLIAPNRAGVLNTKWLTRVEVM